MLDYSFIITLFLFSGAILSVVGSNVIACKNIVPLHWYASWFPEAKPLTTCSFSTNQVIDSTGFVIASWKNENVKAITFASRKRIKYLPGGVGEKFPNLLIYNACNCSIKSISNVNFKGAQKLVILSLRDNEIEKIQVGTFDDLPSLEVIDLSKYFIFLLILLNS